MIEDRPDTHPVQPAGPLLLALLAAAQFTAFVDRNLTAALAPSIKGDFHLSDTALGALQGPYFIGVYTLALLVGGIAAARPDRLRILAGCVLTWTAGAALIALAQTFVQVVAGRLLVGLGQGVFAPCALSFFVSGEQGGARARRLSIYTASSSVGRSAAFLLAGAALVLTTGLPWTPWRTATLAMATPNLLLVMLLIAGHVLRAEEPLSRNVGVVQRKGGSYRAAAAWLGAHPTASVCVFLGAAAGVTAVQTLTAWGASVLQRQFSASATAAALDFGVALTPAALLGHLGGGILIDRFARRGWTPLDVLGCGLLLALAAVAATFIASSALIAAACLAIATLGAATSALAGLAAMQSISPQHLKGPLNALFLGLTSLVGFGVGPLTSGVISDHRGAGSTALLGALVILIGATTLAGVFSAFFGRRAWRRI